jgi:uncharacterized protein YndB with AHSA1/START domain
VVYRTSIDIDAPPDLVWRVLVDVERWPEWSPTMTTIERLDTGTFRTGSICRIKQPRLPPATWRVTSLTPQESFTWTCRSRGVTMAARHVIAARDRGTRAESHFEQAGPLGWLARVFFSRLTRQYLETESEGLKKRCEAG